MCRTPAAKRAVLQGLLLAAIAHVLDADVTGVRMAETSNMGRVLLATRSFSAGDILLREQPVLVWGRGDFISMVQSFVDSGDREQSVVNDMYCPDASPQGLELASQLLATSYPLTPEQILRLIKTAAANCIAYPNEGEILPGFAFSSNLHSLSALFEYGSKLAHSCNPNARAEIFPEASQDAPRSVGFRAIRPIEDGELITFSYWNFALGAGGALSAADILVMPANQRRAVLSNRGFFCHCERCDGQDFCRPLLCGTKGCSEYALLDGKTNVWTCPTCGTLPAARMQTALKFEERMDERWSELHNASHIQAGTLKGRGLPQPADVEKLIQECAQHLGPTHCVVLKALSTLAALCRRTALLMDKLDQAAPTFKPACPDPRLQFTKAELWAQSARTLMLKATRLECVAEGCVGGDAHDHEHEHAPQFFCCQEAEWAGEDVLKLPPYHRDSEVLDFVERYVEVMGLSVPPAEQSGPHAEDDARRAAFLALQDLLAARSDNSSSSSSSSSRGGGNISNVSNSNSSNSSSDRSNSSGSSTSVAQEEVEFVEQALARGLKLGTQVWVNGLKSAPQHNGNKGTVVEFDLEAARIQVRVRAGRDAKQEFQQLRLKLDNLSLTAPPKYRPPPRRKHRRH